MTATTDEQIAALLAQGVPYRSIAAAVGVSVRRVQTVKARGVTRNGCDTERATVAGSDTRNASDTPSVTAAQMSRILSRVRSLEIAVADTVTDLTAQFGSQVAERAVTRICTALTALMLEVSASDPIRVTPVASSPDVDPLTALLVPVR